MDAGQSMHPAEFDHAWTSTAVLGDGSSVTIRPIVPADAEKLKRFHAAQSPESRYMRYFSPKPELSDKEAAFFTNVDFRDRSAFIVEEHGEMIGWANYERWQQRPDAEVAFQVDDNHKGRGVATLLLEHLAAVARANGISGFTAETLGENRRMLSVFAKAGWPLQRRFESGVIDVDFPLDDTAEFVDSMERREQRSDSHAMARLLLPSSIAVIGASDEPASIGAALWRQVAHNPDRPAYPVNINHTEIGGVKAFASVGDIPDEIGLAIIAVPAAQLRRTVDECITKRVRGAVLVTAPLGDEVDIPALIQHARRNGLRIIGPASMGVASPLPQVNLQATLLELTLPAGNIAISMQSGTLGGSLARLANELQLGVSWFVSLGDKIDVSSNDLLQFWEDDEATRVICLYTESVGNPRKFTRIARRVALSRPIIVVRTGLASIGTGADAMYRQSGVIEVPTVQAMLNTARVFAHQRVMTGRRVAVISNARSPLVSTESALRAVGLDPVEPPRQLDWRAGADDYGDAVHQAAQHPDIDALVVVHAPPTEAAVGAPVTAIEAAMADSDTPMVAVMLGAGDGPLSAGSRFASFSFPEEAVAGLARLQSYSAWRASELVAAGDPPSGIDRAAAEAILARQLEHQAETATGRPEDVRDLLGAYGVQMAVTRLVDAADAVAAANEVGYPVAVKAWRRHPGRSVEAGLALDVSDAADVAQTVDLMSQSLGDDASRMWVQKMVAPGNSLRIVVTADERFGPLISVGLGGSAADLIGDESSRVAPLSPSAARHLVGETKAAAVLTTEDDMEAFIDVVVRVAQLASDHPTLAEMTLNPVVVNAGNAIVVDATLVAQHHTTPTRPTRRLEAD